MNPNPTNFIEASLADQIFSRGDDSETNAADFFIGLRPLRWNELVRGTDSVAAGEIKPKPSALRSSQPNWQIDYE